LVREYYHNAPQLQRAGLTAEKTSTTQLGVQDPSQNISNPVAGKRKHRGDSINRSTSTNENQSAVDKAFLDKVWQWLSANPEIWIKRSRTIPTLSNPVQQDHQDDPENGPAGSGFAQQGSVEPLPEAGSTQKGKIKERLYTSQDRRWRALTGHGLDWTRVPKFEFECLAAIATYGTKGVVQGDLIKQTGQDKRSLPTRTEHLHQKGYIEKRLIFKRGTKTSMLYLKKFAPAVFGKSQENGQINEDSDERKSIGRGNTTVGAKPEEALDVGHLLDSIFGVLKDFGIITFDDLKRKLVRFPCSLSNLD
jgi:hypothetical protein